MSMGHRPNEHQVDLWVPTSDLPHSPGHVFYDKLNQLLDQASFDRYVENLCQPYYAEGIGRESIPPGTYFRMLFIGYFEGIASQRGIAWRCSDSLSLRDFLGVALHEATPDHSSLTKIRDRLPLTVHEHVFTFVLKVAQEKKLLRGKTVAVDATTLEANAAMRSIIRKDTGEDWKEYLKRLMAEEGIDNPTDEEMRRFDKKRKNKKVSNQEWQSPTDADSRIAKMKDGTTHLAYKAEHVVDLDSEFVLAAAVHPADASDPSTLMGSVLEAQANLVLAGSEQEIEEAVADKGYHKAQTLAECEQWNTRTYIPEPKRRGYNWEDKPQAWRKATAANRRRVKGARSKRLQKRRSEFVERSFAHVCETGGGRRTWLRGLLKVTKRYVVQVAAHNMGLLMRKLLGMGKPRTLQGGGGCSAWVAWCFYWLSAPWGSRGYERTRNLCSVAYGLTVAF
ncbi:MAG TPA: transposase [Gemmataceae bacterium]|nr:transposase [Gemmataceae bacterium]